MSSVRDCDVQLAAKSVGNNHLNPVLSFLSFGLKLVPLPSCRTQSFPDPTLLETTESWLLDGPLVLHVSNPDRFPIPASNGTRTDRRCECSDLLRRRNVGQKDVCNDQVRWGTWLSDPWTACNWTAEVDINMVVAV